LFNSTQSPILLNLFRLLCRSHSEKDSLACIIYPSRTIYFEL